MRPTARPRRASDEQAHSHYDVIVSPVITEKSTLVSEANQVIFNVAPRRDQGGDQGGDRERCSRSR